MSSAEIGERPCTGAVRPRQRWQGFLLDASPIELVQMWAFNDDDAAIVEALENELLIEGGRVPGVVPGRFYPRALVVGLAPSSRSSGYFHLHVYIEFWKPDGMSKRDLTHWFPRWRWQPSCAHPYDAAQECRNTGIFKERGRFSYEPISRLRPMHLNGDIEAVVSIFEDM